MPYTFVLTPPEEEAPKYVEASQELFSQYEPHYLLNAEGTSSPHITVIQFDTSEKLALEVWEEMTAQMEKENLAPLSPLFVGFSFIEGAGIYEGTTWIELSVLRDAKIMRVHEIAVQTLEKFGLKPLNASGDLFRPHLTLTRIALPQKISAWSKNLFQNTGNFRLAFGVSDEKWQYKEQIASYKIDE